MAFTSSIYHSGSQQFSRYPRGWKRRSPVWLRAASMAAWSAILLLGIGVLQWQELIPKDMHMDTSSRLSASEEWTTVGSRSLLASSGNSSECSSDFDHNGGIVVWILIVLYLFIALAIICDEYFVSSLSLISERLQLSDDVAGATFMAAGSSAPELFTSLADTFIKENQIGIGTIVGSAVFNVLVIVGATAAIVPHALQLTVWPLFRDGVFYSVSIVLLVAFFNDEQIEVWEGVILVLLYALYIVFMKYNEKLQNLAPTCLGPRSSCIKVGEDDVADVVPVAAKQERTKVEEWRSPVDDADMECKDLIASGRSKTPDQNGKIIDTVSNTPLRFVGDVESSVAVPPAIALTSVDNNVNPADVEVSSPMSATATTSLAASPNPAVRASGSGPFGMLENGGTSGSSSGSSPTANDHLDRTKKRLKRSDTAQYSVSDDDAERIGLPRQGSRVQRRKSFDHEPVFRRSYRAHEVDEEAQRVENASVDEDFCRNARSEIDQFEDQLAGMSHVERANWLLSLEFPWHRVGRDERRPEDVDFETGHHKDIEDALDIYIDGPWYKKLFTIFCLPLLYIFKYTVPDCRKERFKTWYVCTFAMSIVWIGVLSHFMVDLTSRIGCIIGIPPQVMGLTFLAAGTSVPDMLSSLSVAKDGHGDMAVSNALGSNVFDICLGLGFPWMLKTIIDGTAMSVCEDGILVFTLILLGLLAAFIFILIGFRWRLTRKAGWTFLVLYTLFVTYAILRALVFNDDCPELK